MLGKYTVVTTIAVNDLENAEYFYGSVLGMKKTINHLEGVRYESGNGAISLYESPMAGSAQTMVAWWVVENVEAVVRKLKKRGILFELNKDMPFIRPEGDIYVLGNGLKAAWFKDPDGNLLGIGNL